MELANLELRDASNFTQEPEYLVELSPSNKRVTVTFNGEVVADSRRALIMRETRLAPVFYLPREDVRMAFLEAGTHQTHCPFKGNASYWHLVVKGRRAENAAWSYEEPLHEVAGIRNYVAFYNNKVDGLLEEHEEVAIDAEAETHQHSNPLVDWLIREAWEAATPEELVARFVRRLVESGIGLWRANVLVGTLNPIFLGTTYVWRRDRDGVQVGDLPHERADSPEFMNSPLVPIRQGAGGIRRRLDVSGIEFDFPILEDLHAQGCTDYVAMPLHFSDGQINAVTLATDRQGGFSTSDLGKVYEVLPVLSRFLEVHALRRTTRSLLDTYLGRHTGDLVLNGRVRRGDGENIPAVIWYCDLRESTRLAETLSREAYLSLLNEFFDRAAGSVLGQGGEVLKFIGDAVLAIFPIEDCAIKTAEACRRALAAAVDLKSRIDEFNRTLPAGERAPLRYALALHLGEVTYGNVGAADRLDFTVIGPAANEAARLGSLCKELGHPLLATDRFADVLPDEFTSVGKFELRGVAQPVELFRPVAAKQK